jgi:hypothetical protein
MRNCQEVALFSYQLFTFLRELAANYPMFCRKAEEWPALTPPTAIQSLIVSAITLGN